MPDTSSSWPTILIIDDEWYARNSLKMRLQESFPAFNVVHEAQDVPTAVELIKKIEPDLIFLDMEMPKFSGAELFNFFEKDEINAKVVFTTAFTHYAHVAFDLVVADYLLKPISKEHLERAVKKVLQKSTILETLPLLNLDDKDLFISENQVLKIALNTQEGTVLVPLSDIISLRADGSYTFFSLKNHNRLIITRRLAEFDRLEEHNFLRIHRSHMINLTHITKITKQSTVIMQNNEEYPIANERRTFLKNWVSQYKL
jgi:two-component system LytT family response regulator